MNKFQTEEPEIAGGFLAKNTSRNGRSFVGNEARGGRRGRWDCQLNKLFRLKEMRGGNASACGAYVQGLSEFDKLHAHSVRTPQKDRDLYSNTRVLPLLGGGHRFLSLQNLTRHLGSL